MSQKILYEELIKKINSGRYSLKAIARDTTLGEKTIYDFKYERGSPRPRTVQLIASWLRDPRDMRPELEIR